MIEFVSFILVERSACLFQKFINFGVAVACNIVSSVGYLRGMKILIRVELYCSAGTYN